MVRRKRKSGVNPSDRARIKKRLPSLGTALARRTKQALFGHGQEWFSRMSTQFRAPLVPFGQVNRNTTLHTRSGLLKNSLHWKVTGSKLRELGLEMRSDAPYARTQEYGGRIKASGGGMLAIPIDDNIKPSGDRRWSSPLDPEIVDGFFLETNNALYYVRRTTRTRNKRTQVETTEDLQFLFLLKKEVDIPGPRSTKRRQKSRLGLTENAVGAGPRNALRRRLIRGIIRALQDISGGSGARRSGGGLAGPVGKLPG